MDQAREEDGRDGDSLAYPHGLHLAISLPRDLRFIWIWAEGSLSAVTAKDPMLASGLYKGR